jgi:Ca2+-transporting ATPase
MLRFSGLEHSERVATARTMAFATLILSELARVYTCRSERYPLLRLGVFSNRMMQYAVGFSMLLLLLVVYLPFLQPVFGTVPITLREWGLIVPLVLLPSLMAELQKAVSRRLEARAAAAQAP